MSRPSLSLSLSLSLFLSLSLSHRLLRTLVRLIFATVTEGKGDSHSVFAGVLLALCSRAYVIRLKVSVRVCLCAGVVIRAPVRFLVYMYLCAPVGVFALEKLMLIGVLVQTSCGPVL